MNAMKAIVCTRYGPPEVLVPAELPKPAPLDNEVLIRIHATTCHFGDVRVRGAILPLWMQLPFRLYMGFRQPKRKILGMELSGVVDLSVLSHTGGAYHRNIHRAVKVPGGDRQVADHRGG